MTIDAGDRGRGAGAGDLHADRGLHRAYDAFVAKQKPRSRATECECATGRTSTGRSSRRAPRASRAELDAWAASTSPHGSRRDVDAALPRAGAPLGDAGWLRHAVAAAHGGALTRSTRARSASRARRSRATRPRRLRVRDAGPRLAARSASPARRRRSARYLPRVARGEAIAAFALSEPDAGLRRRGDGAARARATATTAVLDGEKTWISNGGIADFYVVFARTRRGAGRARHLGASSSMPTRRASRSPSAST